MKLSIIKLLALTGYAAILINSIRTPSLGWAVASQLAVFVACGVAVLLAIRNRNSHATGFAVFAITSPWFFQVPSEFKMFLLSNVSTLTGGVDLKYLQSTVDSHAILLCGFCGLLASVLLGCYAPYALDTK